jgi:hypothetical protein
MTRFTRTSNGKYSVKGRAYEMLIGTRAQVWHGTAHKTSGGLTKSDLFQNKAGRIVSKAKHFTAKKERRLVKAGFGTKKGKFGFVKLGKTKSKRGGTSGSVHLTNHHMSNHASAHHKGGMSGSNHLPKHHNMGHHMSHHSSNHMKHYKGGMHLPKHHNVSHHSGSHNHHKSN